MSAFALHACMSAKSDTGWGDVLLVEKRHRRADGGIELAGLFREFVVPGFCATDATHAQNSCRVGRNRISLMSTSSGWLMANSTQRAKLLAGIALCS
ncbi:hypothetical protein D3C87_1317160 [compost metagenome]